MTPVFTLIFFSLFVVILGVQPLPPHVMRGVAITPDGPFTLADNATLVLLDQAVKIGCDWIFVNTYLSQLNATSSRVFKGPQAPLDSVLKSFIDIAQAKGLKVLLKPLIIPLDGSSFLHLEPSNPDTWFTSYTDILCEYTTLLPQLDALSIGLELMSLTVPSNYTSHWNQLIKQVRSSTDAALTYSSLFYIEWRAIRFWDQLDWIGIDEYLPVASEENPYPSISEMTDQISNYFGEVRNYREKNNLTSKQVVLTELGIYSFTNATFAPALFPPGYKICNGSYYGNFTTQQRYYEASFNAINMNSDLISGVFLYHFDNPSTSDYCRPCNLMSGDAPTNDPTFIPDDDDSLFGRIWACGLTFRGKLAMQTAIEAYSQPETTNK